MKVKILLVMEFLVMEVAITDEGSGNGNGGVGFVSLVNCLMCLMAVVVMTMVVVWFLIRLIVGANFRISPGRVRFIVIVWKWRLVLPFLCENGRRKNPFVDDVGAVRAAVEARKKKAREPSSLGSTARHSGLPRIASDRPPFGVSSMLLFLSFIEF